MSLKSAAHYAKSLSYFALLIIFSLLLPSVQGSPAESSARSPDATLADLPLGLQYALSAAVGADDPRWFPKFISAPSILICMDDDEAGQRAAEKLRKLSLAARCIQVPQGKDINEFHKRTKEEAVRLWIKESMKSDLYLNEPKYY